MLFPQNQQKPCTLGRKDPERRKELSVRIKPGSRQLSTSQLLAHPFLSPPAGWGGEMDKKRNLWVEITTV